MGPLPIIKGMMAAFRESVAQMRTRVSRVRYGEVGVILFDFDGKTYATPEPRELLPVDAGEAGKAWAVRRFLDGEVELHRCNSERGSPC